MQAASTPTVSNRGARWIPIVIGFVLIATLATVAYVESGNSESRLTDGPSAEQIAAGRDVPSDPNVAITDVPQYAENGQTAEGVATAALEVFGAPIAGVARERAAQDLAELTVLDTYDITLPDGRVQAQVRFQTADGRLLILGVTPLNGQTVDASAIAGGAENRQVREDGSEITWSAEEHTVIVLKNDYDVTIAASPAPGGRLSDVAWNIEELIAIAEALAVRLAP
jgi:hypothetical protein